MAIRITLKGFIEFSSDLSQVAQDITDAIKEASQTFKKVGEEGTEIERYAIDGRRLKLELKSGRALRAHDALLRLKNQLARRLGPKRIGARRVFIEDLEVILKGGHVGESKAKDLLKGVAEVQEVEGNLILRFRDLTDRDIRERTIDRAIRLSLVKEEKVEVKAEKLAPFGTIIKRGEEKPFKLSARVASEAEKLGWIKRYPARGQWIYAPPMAALIRAISELLIEKVAKPLGFKEWMFPRLMPIEVFRKLSTYVEHLPEGVFYVCVPPRDPSKFDEFKREYKLRRELRTDLLKEILSEPQYVLEAIQCTPFYQFFSGEIVRLEDLPVKAYDLLGGWTWRNEAGGVEGIVRTNEFWRLEMVFLSTPEEVIEIRNKVTDLTVELIDKDLDMEWRIVAGAPFYLSPEEAAKRMIDVSNIDKIPTLDVEVYLPYRGPRDEAEWLEITAASVHRDFYVSHFKIKEARGRDIWTGCVGHGLTRWVAGFLARHGFNFDDWPKAIKEKIGELPEPPKTVT